MGLKTALVKPRTVLSHGEAGKGELTQMLCKQEERKPHREVTMWLYRHRASDTSPGPGTKSPHIRGIGWIHREHRQPESGRASHHAPCLHFL